MDTNSGSSLPTPMHGSKQRPRCPIGVIFAGTLYNVAFGYMAIDATFSPYDPNRPYQRVFVIPFIMAIIGDFMFLRALRFAIYDFFLYYYEKIVTTFVEIRSACESHYQQQKRLFTKLVQYVPWTNGEKELVSTSALQQKIEMV